MKLETTRLCTGSYCLSHNCRRLLIHALRKATAVFVVAGIGATLCTNASATSVIFTGSLLSSNLSASATFTDLGGGNLQITLANTYTGDTVDQSHVLTALFFSGATGLTPVSALAAPGSLQWVSETSTPAGGEDVGTNWQYLSGTGISSSGLGIFSSGNFSPSPGAKLAGSAWGLLSEGYEGLHLDGLDSRTYIQYSVVFTLSGFTGSLSDISGVSFQYGTSLTEPNVTTTVVPEPASMTLLAVSMGLWAVLRLRSLRSQRAKH